MDGCSHIDGEVDVNNLGGNVTERQVAHNMVFLERKSVHFYSFVQGNGCPSQLNGRMKCVGKITD